MKRKPPPTKAIRSRRFDRKLFFLVVFAVFLGVLAVADASGPLAIRMFSDKFYFAKLQATYAFIGIIAMLVAAKINYKYWDKVAVPMFAVGLVTLMMVFIPGVGRKILGASRWVDLGVFSFQPSELIKLSLVIYFSKVFSSAKTLSAYIVPLVTVCFLIMLQPDLGTTSIIAGFAMAQIFMSGVNILKLAGIGFLGAGAAIILILTSEYRKARLMTFLQVSEDPLNKGYHIRQILLALGSGGFFGVGLGQSRQKFLFLPETATDSIFAIIAEEVGFFGSFLLIALIASIVYRGFLIAKKAPDNFSFMLAVGISSWIGVQTVLNLAAMVALVPLTGIPLPFISYGGTSLIMQLAGIGILLNISKNVKAQGSQKNA